MMQMESRMEELKKLVERVKILKDFHIACKKRTGRAFSRKKDARAQLISLPKLRANSKFNEKKIPALYKGPTENIHVSGYRETMATFPDSMSREKWSKEEKENIGKGVKQQFQGMLLQRSVELFSCIDGSSGDLNNIDSIISSIKDLDFNPERVRLFLPKVNWEGLAGMYVPGHSGAECQARFFNYEDPLINHNTWTAMEDKNLLHIVQQRGLSNWIDISVLLGTNRTPFQCLARYQKSLNASILKREWTKEEDDKLRDSVETFGESNWQLVASVMEGRTGTQCSNRWLKTLHPARKRVGKWTTEEDKRMKIAVMLFGPKTWKKGERGLNAAPISYATEIGLDEVPRLTYGSELENMHRKPLLKKGRSKRSYSTKQNTVPLSDSYSSPCTDGMSNGEAIRESALHYNNPKSSSRLEEKRSRFRGEYTDGFPRSAAIFNRTRVIEQGSNEGEDVVPVKECPSLVDSNFQRVAVSTDASQSSRVSKLRARRSVNPRNVMLETPSEAEMPLGDATLLKMQEKTEDGKIGTHAADDNLSPFPDSMSLMEIINQIRAAKVVKARKKKRTENQETVSGGECVAQAIGGESAPSTPWPADVNLSGMSTPFMEEITSNVHSMRDDHYLDVLKEFDDYVISSEMCKELQNAGFLSHHSTRVNISEPCMVGNDNGGLAKDTKVGIQNEDPGVSSKF